MNKQYLTTSVFVFFFAVNVSIAHTESDSGPWRPKSNVPEAKRLRALLAQPESNMDLATIKFTIDKMIDPTINVNAGVKQIDDIVVRIRTMLGTNPSSNDKMLAIKKYLYENGPWNEYRPYHYDFDDPMGTKIHNKLLTNYLASRKGNCISMPFLFIILGQRLRIDVTASTAPLHVLVKYTDSATGVTINLETTSGANLMRDEWYRKQMPMTDQAIANKLYLQKLTQRETVVVMGTVLAEHYFLRQAFDKVTALSDVALTYYPHYPNAMIMNGNAYYRLLEKQFIQKYSDAKQIPVHEREYFHFLSNNNRSWFAKAEKLGWHQPSQEDEKNYLNAVKRDAERAPR